MTVTSSVLQHCAGRTIAWAQHRRATRPPIVPSDRGAEGWGQTALVTGASAGIGRAMAELLAAKGFHVVVIARDSARLTIVQKQLEAQYGVRVLPIVCDLSNPSAAQTICATLEEGNIRIDVLVNNAGYTVIGEFSVLDWDDHQRFVQTVALTPIELTWMLLPGMLERGRGRIINVASVSALFAGSPGMVLYSAAKSMLMKFTQGLADECERQGVTCTVSIPGVTASEFFERNNMSPMFERQLAAQLAAMRPEDVAREMYTAAARGQRVVIHGWHHRVAMFLLGRAPASVQYAAARRINGLAHQR